MPAPTVEVVFTKWDGRLHWHFELLRLGHDEHGVWLGCPPGAAVQRGSEPAKTVHDGFVLVVPDAGSWMALWNAEREPEVYADVTSEPLWSPGSVTAVDLDLDVIRRRDGTVALLDEDEFADHQVRFGYPAAVVAEVTATALAGAATS